MIRRSFLKAFALPAMIPGRGKRMPFGNAVGEGFVNPGVVVARKVIVEGNQGGVFIYSTPSPQLGTLISSDSTGGFTDSAGNFILQGQVTYTNGAGFFFANAMIGAEILWYVASSAGGPYVQTATINVGSLGNMSISLNNKLTLSFNGGATVGTVPQSGGSGITTVAQLVTALENMGLLTP